MAEQKVTAQMAMEIFTDYYEYGMTMREIADKYELNKCTVHRHLHKKNLLDKYSGKINERRQMMMLKREIAELKVLKVAPKMVDQLVAIGSQDVKETSIKYQYAIQNAASDLLNRAGVRPKEEESHEVRVVIDSGIELGTPEGE